MVFALLRRRIACSTRACGPRSVTLGFLGLRGPWCSCCVSADGVISERSRFFQVFSAYAEASLKEHHPNTNSIPNDRSSDTDRRIRYVTTSISAKQCRELAIQWSTQCLFDYRSVRIATKEKRHLNYSKAVYMSGALYRNYTNINRYSETFVSQGLYCSSFAL